MVFSELEGKLDAPSLGVPATKVLQSLQAHWSGLTVFVDHPEVPIDSAAERALRPPVVGRTNYYGSGRVWPGELAATMFDWLKPDGGLKDVSCRVALLPM